MRAIFFIPIFLLCASALSAQNNHPLSCRFEQYYLQGDMESWRKLTDSMQNESLSKQESDILLQAQYGLIGYYFAQDEKKDAAVLYKSFEKLLEKLLDIYPHNPDYLSYKAASFGFRIGFAPLRAPFLSSQHLRAIEEAGVRNRGNALPYIEQGNSYYFRPSVVGGDKQKAKAAYEQALAILQEQEHCDWLYYNTASWLGQVYTNLGEAQKAHRIYTKLLEQAPHFEYVRDELLPQLERGEYIDVGSRVEQNIIAK